MGLFTAGGGGAQHPPIAAPILGLRDLDADRIRWLLGVAAEIGDRPDRVETECASRTVGLVFGSPEPFTKAAFEVGVRQMGGNAVYFSPSDLGMGATHASSAGQGLGDDLDFAVLGHGLSGLFDALVVRSHEHARMQRFADAATVPVISAGSDMADPCAALGDLHAAKDRLGTLQGRKLALISTVTGRARSLAFGAAALGMDVVFAPGTDDERGSDGTVAGLRAETLAAAQEIGARSGARVDSVTDPLVALRDADVVFADTPLGPDAAEEASGALGLGNAGLGHPPVGDGRLHACKVLVLFMLDLI